MLAPQLLPMILFLMPANPADARRPPCGCCSRLCVFSKDFARRLRRPRQGEMRPFAVVGSRNVHVRESRLQGEPDVKGALGASGGYRHLLDVLLENYGSFEPVRAGDAPDGAASGLAKVGFVLSTRRDVVVVPAVPLLADMILPRQRDDEILRPRGRIAVALEPRVSSR